MQNSSSVSMDAVVRRLDGQGKVRGGLAIDSDNGTVRLALADGNEKTRAEPRVAGAGWFRSTVIASTVIARDG